MVNRRILGIIRGKLANAAVKNMLYLTVECLNIQISRFGVFFKARKTYSKEFSNTSIYMIVTRVTDSMHFLKSNLPRPDNNNIHNYEYFKTC